MLIFFSNFIIRFQFSYAVQFSGKGSRRVEAQQNNYNLFSCERRDRVRAYIDGSTSILCRNKLRDAITDRFLESSGALIIYFRPLPNPPRCRNIIMSATVHCVHTMG